MTVGVLNRVAQLADRKTVDSEGPFWSVIPLKETLAQIAGVGAGSKRVCREYNRLIPAGHSELELLMNVSPEKIASCGGSVLAEAIQRMRAREIQIEEGYDGEYGTVQAFFRSETGMGGSDSFGPAPPGVCPAESGQKRPPN